MIVARQLIAWNIPKKSAGPVGTIDYEVDRLMYLGDFRARDQALSGTRAVLYDVQAINCLATINLSLLRDQVCTKLSRTIRATPTTCPYDMGFNRQPLTAKR
jgi:hypothetical protein